MGRKCKETTLEERKIIINLFKEGKSYAKIAEILKRSRSTIQSIINKFKTEGILHNLKRSGRPRKLSLREERKIVRIIKKIKNQIPVHLKLHQKFGNICTMKYIRKQFEEYCIEQNIKVESHGGNHSSIKLIRKRDWNLQKNI